MIYHKPDPVFDCYLDERVLAILHKEMSEVKSPTCSTAGVALIDSVAEMLKTREWKREYGEVMIDALRTRSSTVALNASTYAWVCAEMHKPARDLLREKWSSLTALNRNCILGAASARYREAASLRRELIERGIADRAKWVRKMAAIRAAMSRISELAPLIHAAAERETDPELRIELERLAVLTVHGTRFEPDPDGIGGCMWRVEPHGIGFRTMLVSESESTVR